jgi:glutamyl-tRNA reductase
MSSSALYGFHVVGVTFRTAPVGVRERLLLASTDAAAWLEEQRSAGRCAAILSTCNRFEVYWLGSP